MALADYKIWFEAEYKHPPGMKCIESFLRLYPPKEYDPTVEKVSYIVPEEFWRENPLDG